MKLNLFKKIVFRKILILLKKLNGSKLKKEIKGKIYIEITENLAYEINSLLNNMEYLNKKK